MIGTRWIVVQLLMLCTAGWFATPAAAATCKEQFRAAYTAAGKNYTEFEQFIDDDTPADACTIKLCDGDYQTCDPIQHGNNVPKSDYILVFSDEFTKDYRELGSEKGDIRWTAEDMYYFPTQDVEVYKPDQVLTWMGNLVFTLDRLKRPESAITLQPDGEKWNVPKNFAGGMVSGWNKFCMTGGYMEARVRMPGDPNVAGFWPAFWAMGNLGRQGYMASTSGFWPYSYSECGNGSAKNSSIPGSKVPSQTISACLEDPPGLNRTLYGFKPGQARGAPEFDVFEASTSGGPHVSQTLQMAPLVPVGQSWDDLEWYGKNGLPNGLEFPGGISITQTNMNEWDGVNGRPGNEFQDSYSAISRLNQSFYTDFHTFGVDWKPNEYLRWYIDGQFVYEVNKYALVERSDGSMTIGQRMIPIEPMYMILNLGISESFGIVDIERLTFPAYMRVDYVRVWQKPDQLNLGCSPPEMPTEQWIACHKENYIVLDKDDVLIKAKCESSAVAVKMNGGLMGAVVVGVLMLLGLL